MQIQAYHKGFGSLINYDIDESTRLVTHEGHTVRPLDNHSTLEEFTDYIKNDYDHHLAIHDDDHNWDIAVDEIKDGHENDVVIKLENGDVFIIQTHEGKHNENCLTFFNGEESFEDAENKFNLPASAVMDWAIAKAEEYKRDQVRVIDANLFKCAINNEYPALIEIDDTFKVSIMDDRFTGTGACLASFGTEEEARRWIDGFRTKRHHDFEGLKALLGQRDLD